MDPARLVFGFFLGIMTIAFLAVITENWLVVATMGIVHIVGFVALTLLFLSSSTRPADPLARQWTLHLPARWPWQHDFIRMLARIRALPAAA
ncbi:MAG: transposase [Actinomycetota bacterium]|nr:transposase [Actinomycetota bacterium]